MQPFKRPKRNTATVTVAINFVLIAVAVFILFLIIKIIVVEISVPALHADNIRDSLKSKASLIAKINELENIIGTQKESLAEAVLLQKENEKLKIELNREGASTGTLARVLTAPGRNFYSTIIIDAGSAQGLSEGQIVYAFGSVALGTVAIVQEHRATIELFSAANRQVAGTAEDSDVALTMIGRGAGEYEVRMPRDVSFRVGEMISYQSIDTAILAKVEKIITDPRDPFQSLLAKVPVNLSTLKFVIIR